MRYWRKFLSCETAVGRCYSEGFNIVVIVSKVFPSSAILEETFPSDGDGNITRSARLKPWLPLEVLVSPDGEDVTLRSLTSW